MRNLFFVSALIFGATISTSVAADSAKEIQLMKRVFEELQPISFAKNREYCGYIGFDFDGNLVASPARRGRKASCRARDPKNIEIIVASYHTHGGFDWDEGHELPSVSDIEGDEAEGIDGYVATPGGRLWYVDTEDMIVSQICGPGCLPQHADYQELEEWAIEESYSYEELQDFFAE